MTLPKTELDVGALVQAAREAFAAGALADYKPLMTAGAAFGSSTSMTSWGPQMKR